MDDDANVSGDCQIERIEAFVALSRRSEMIVRCREMSVSGLNNEP